MTTRVVVLGAGAAGLSAANRLARHAEAGAPIEVVLVERTGEHAFWPGLVPVLFGEADPGEHRRAVPGLLRPGVHLVVGEVETLDPEDGFVRGSFGELGFDELVVALGVEVAWGERAPACGELAPWTLAGALAGRQALEGARPGTRLAVGPADPAYRCPPAVFDLAVRLARWTGATVEVFHPWQRPLAPFGEGPAAAVSAMLAGAGVGFRGGFSLEQVLPGELVSRSGERLGYDLALVVPPHRAPRCVADSPLAGPTGWPEVTFPSLTHPRFDRVSLVGDLAAPALSAGMAGTLGVLEGGFVADRLAARASGAAGPLRPSMSALCFLDDGRVGSLLHCDFAAPAAAAGPPACDLLPPLPFFRSAKRLFAEEWFTGMLGGDAV